MPTLDLVPATTEDFRRRAERRLPRFLFDFVDGGANDEETMRRNVTDFRRLTLRQRVMRDVSLIDTSTTLPGTSAEMPVALAPVGMAGMLARRGEVQAKRAADEAGIPFTLSTVSICPMEEVAAVSDVPYWFQLYMLKDRGVVEEMLQRAADLGVRTLVFTVDLAVIGARYRDVRNGIAGGASGWGRFRSGPVEFLSHPRWLRDVGLGGKPHTFGNLSVYVPKATSVADYRSWVAEQFDASVTWKDIEWLRGIWKGELVIKGVLGAEDALAAAEAGADAVSVSNHGGRQLDGVATAIATVPRVRDALPDRTRVLMDGGVRSGLDVARAVALGADGVMLGRAWAWSIGAGGQSALTRLLNGFRSELAVAMGLGGVTRVADLDRDMIERIPDEWL